MVGLIDPLEVKGLILQNRLVLPAMQTNLATKEGAVTSDLIDYYVKHCRNIGLLIVEHSYISLDGKFSEKQLGIYDDKLIEGLENLTSKIHAEGVPVIIQISHAGLTAKKETTGFEPVAPSTTENARELEIQEVAMLIDAYVSAAIRAMKSGFDGVEVHGAHNFLLNQFYSPLTNRRKDQYGGSLEKRVRFPLEVVEKIRQNIGGRLLLYRLGSVDLNTLGTQITDSKQFAMLLEEKGVDILDVSGGVCGSRPPVLQAIQGYFIPQAQQIKAVVKIPVIGVGGITDPDYADKVIKEKKVDLVAVGRTLRNNPEWATQAITKMNTRTLR